uniref:Uncharacterized protein n=1 Tax=Electrophorus electricus TaxID=8005 RepID=A0A4W4EPJ8_ELEEL
MLTDEASQIQEVRYCLKTLREQMATRYNNNNKVSKSLLQTERVQQAESKMQRQDQHTEKLQRLLGDLEMENSTLHDKMAAREAELQELRKLEKELIIQKEKIHHLDDMVKSQQRKVRHMIEQLQNSRTVIEERDHFISDLEEKVAFLEAEVSIHLCTFYFCLSLTVTQPFSFL